jgi:hypothetical protein
MLVLAGQSGQGGICRTEQDCKDHWDFGAYRVYDPSCKESTNRWTYNFGHSENNKFTFSLPKPFHAHLKKWMQLDFEDRLEARGFN